MWSAEEAAAFWMDNHTRDEWKELLKLGSDTELIPQEVCEWLEGATEALGDPIATQLEEKSFDNAANRFQTAFIAQVREADDLRKRWRARLGE